MIVKELQKILRKVVKQRKENEKLEVMVNTSLGHEETTGVKIYHKKIVILY